MYNNIRKFIDEKNLKITDVISKTEISKSYFYNVMNGTSTPTLIIARKIAKVLCVDIKELFPELEE